MPTSITIGGITITPQELETLTDAVVETMQTTSKDPAAYPEVNTLSGITSLPVFRQSEGNYELVRLLATTLKGADGRSLEMRLTSTYVQYRLSSSVDAVNGVTIPAGQWQNLIPIAVLQQPAADAIDLYAQDIYNLNNLKFDSVQLEEEGLCFYANGTLVAGPIEVATGSGSGSGGGSATGSTIRLQNLSGTVIGAAAGQSVVINYNFTSTDAETGEETGDASAEFYVNNTRVQSTYIHQGQGSFNVTPYLNAGVNTFRMRVTDSYNAVRSFNVNISVLSISLSSPFDDTVVYDSQITFNYTPVGSGSKTIYFKIDEQILDPVTTTATNRQLSYLLPTLQHGAHNLEVYATMEVEGVSVTSNTLRYAIIYIEAQNQQKIIASHFAQTEATQYDTLTIPFCVYNPQSLTQQVYLIANGDVINTITVDRTQQTWSYRIPDEGNLILEISDSPLGGDGAWSIQIQVAASNINAEAETSNLELFLTAENRNNNEQNPAQWTYSSVDAGNAVIDCTFNNFNFVTNGWLPDPEGVTALNITPGSYVTVNFQPFSTDFKTTGKTLEIEFAVHDVTDFDKILISCLSSSAGAVYGDLTGSERGLWITPNTFNYRSALSSIATNFKEDEIVRLSLVIENRYNTRLLLMYINGIASGALQYTLADDFSQQSPVSLTLGTPPLEGTGGPGASLRIYSIRSYNAPLNNIQIINNYIADTAHITKKLAIYDRNQITDACGEIIYSELVEKLPCMTITGALPTFKGDKKTVSIAFENRQRPELSFTSTNVQIDVQGTSSQFYPRKNFKTKHNGGFLMTESQEQLSLYPHISSSVDAVNGVSPIPAKIFCQKADFAESSGTHNTGLARYINAILLALDIKTPPQYTNPAVRTTIDGYPMALFHKATDIEAPVFIGKYNFNHDKGAEDVFGFDDDSGAIQCWEFLNNTSDLCLFKSDVFNPLGEANSYANDLEARYPEEYTDITQIQALWTWVVSCIGDTQKFADELNAHFNKDNLISYYVLTELFGMVDQRAKNMFITSWGNEGDGPWKWYFIFYDNDTGNGINNEGAIAFGYNIEDTDEIGAGHVWNGWDSALWTLVRNACPDDIKSMYATLRQTISSSVNAVHGVLSYDAALTFLNTDQADKWAEAVYNLDGQYKYIQPIIESGNASYLYALQGARTEHRKWWLKNRFNYLDSKYNTAAFAQNFITMRIYTPASWQGVEPDADFDITCQAHSYAQVKYGSYIISQRAQAKETIHITAPDITFNDTETIVYGAESLDSVGSLAAKYPGTVDISNAPKLTELIIGSDADNYQNQNLTHITIGNNTLLKVIDLQGCISLTEPLDVSGCANISTILATGAAISMVLLPPAGILEYLALPATITNLTIKNQPLLTPQNLLINNIPIVSSSVDAVHGVIPNTSALQALTNLQTLIIENALTPPLGETGGLPTPMSQSLLVALASLPSVQRIRLINVNWQAPDLTTLLALANLAGIDHQGNNINTPVISGVITIENEVEEEMFNLAQSAFPELEIIADVFVIPYEDIPYSTTMFLLQVNSDNNALIDATNRHPELTYNNAGQLFNNALSGKWHRALNFVLNVADYVHIPQTAFSDISGGNWSMEFWYKSNDQTYGTNSGCWVVSQWDASYGYIFFLSLSISNISVQFKISNGNNTSISYSSTAINNNTWHHICLSRNGLTIKAFIDGVNVGSMTTLSNYPWQSTPYLYLHWSKDSNPPHYRGTFQIEDFVISTTPRTADFTPPAGKLRINFNQ